MTQSKRSTKSKAPSKPDYVKKLEDKRDNLVEEFNKVQKFIEQAKEENQQRLGKINLLIEQIGESNSE